MTFSSVAFVQLDLHKLASAGTDHDKTLLARRIEATARQIDMGMALRANGRGDRDCRGSGKIGKKMP
jgi:hypothetical protein